MTEDDAIKFARSAYTAYGQVTDFKNYQGLPMPSWLDLTPTIRSAWVAAVLEAISHVKLIVDTKEQKTLDVSYL